jgi:hypothetical protein
MRTDRPLEPMPGGVRRKNSGTSFVDICYRLRVGKPGEIGDTYTVDKLSLYLPSGLIEIRIVEPMKEYPENTAYVLEWYAGENDWQHMPHNMLTVCYGSTPVFGDLPRM